MSDVSRRDKLEAWRNKRKQQLKNSVTQIPHAKRARGDDNEVISTTAEKENVLTPTKMLFDGMTSSVAPSTDGRKTKVSTMSIRAKLEQSARKKKAQIERKKKDALLAERQKVFQSGLESIGKVSGKEDHLHQVVEAQTKIAEEMLGQGKIKETRHYLKELHGEMPDCEKVGSFWLVLAKLEQKIGNINRARSVFACGLLKTADFNLRESCSEFLFSKEVLVGQEIIKNVNTLLEEPLQLLDDDDGDDDDPLIGGGDLGDSKSDGDGDDLLSQFLQYNPNTCVKKPREKQQSSPKEAIQVASVLKSKPGRVPLSMKKKISFKMEGGASSSSKNPKSAAKKDQQKEESPEQGSFVTVAAVKSSKKAQDQLGNTRTMTPVRRSARLVKDSDKKRNIKDLLKETDYTYTPNHLVQSMTKSHHDHDDEQEEDLLV